MFKRLPSALVSAGVDQFNMLVDRAMASTLPTGTISALNYGHRLMNVFSGLLSTAVSTALYPQMIEMITLKKEDELKKLVVKIINIFSILMIPVTIACFLFRTEIVSAVFERGSFDSASTAVTSGVFAFYCTGILFIACNAVVTNIFYGYGNTKTPMFISIANLVINVGLNLTFIHFWGVNGLALATSMSAFITFFVRMKAVDKHIRLEKKDMVLTALKVIIASAVACGVPRAIFTFYPMNKYITLVISAAIGFVLYLVLIKLLRVREIHDLVALLMKKLKPKKK
jgi:putative peptidoglycan lipid II flippase